MPERLKILIVEDEQPVADVLERLVAPLKDSFPGSQVILATRMADALEIIGSIPSPDITLLDLSLPDSSIEETIGRLRDIEAVCPVVIVTGHATERVIAMMGDLKVPVIDKSIALFESNFLVRAIVRVVEAWQKNRWARIDRNLNRMKEMIDATP